MRLAFLHVADHGKNPDQPDESQRRERGLDAGSAREGQATGRDARQKHPFAQRPGELGVGGCEAREGREDQQCDGRRGETVGHVGCVLFDEWGGHDHPSLEVIDLAGGTETFLFEDAGAGLEAQDQHQNEREEQGGEEEGPAHTGRFPGGGQDNRSRGPCELAIGGAVSGTRNSQ